MRNAEDNLKAKKKILAEEKKGVRFLERIPQDLSQAETKLKAEKEEIFEILASCAEDQIYRDQQRRKAA